MTAIALSFEQIRNAPPEVRRWIEQEVATTLGLQIAPTGSHHQGPSPASYRADELAAVLTMIQGVFPAVDVFFELGREGRCFAKNRLEAYRLSDIQHYTLLQTTDQVISCLDLIEKSLHRIRGSAAAPFYGVDGDYCFVARETQQNIQRLWLDQLERAESGIASLDGASGEGRP